MSAYCMQYILYCYKLALIPILKNNNETTTILDDKKIARGSAPGSNVDMPLKQRLKS